MVRRNIDGSGFGLVLFICLCHLLPCNRPTGGSSKTPQLEASPLPKCAAPRVASIRAYDTYGYGVSTGGLKGELGVQPLYPPRGGIVYNYKHIHTALHTGCLERSFGGDILWRMLPALDSAACAFDVFSRLIRTRNQQASQPSSQARNQPTRLATNQLTNQLKRKLKTPVAKLSFGAVGSNSGAEQQAQSGANKLVKTVEEAGMEFDMPQSLDRPIVWTNKSPLFLSSLPGSTTSCTATLRRFFGGRFHCNMCR